MHVDLRLPSTWVIAIAPGGSVRAACAAHPGVEIAAAPLTIREDNLVAWSRRVLHVELDTDDAGLTLAVDEQGTTEDGWPARFVVAAPARDPGAAVALAFYHFLDYAAHAAIRGPGAAELLPLLRAARPDYRTDAIVALDQLWR